MRTTGGTAAFKHCLAHTHYGSVDQLQGEAEEVLGMGHFHLEKFNHSYIFKMLEKKKISHSAESEI